MGRKPQRQVGDGNSARTWTPVDPVTSISATLFHYKRWLADRERRLADLERAHRGGKRRKVLAWHEAVRPVFDALWAEDRRTANAWKVLGKIRHRLDDLRRRKVDMDEATIVDVRTDNDAPMCEALSCAKGYHFHYRRHPTARRLDTVSLGQVEVYVNELRKQRRSA